MTDSEYASYAAHAPALLASMDREWRRAVLAVFAAATEYQAERLKHSYRERRRHLPSEASLRADAELAVRDSDFSLFVAHLAARGPDALLAYVNGAKRALEARFAQSGEPKKSATVAAQTP